jgi:hypothetical protein
VTILNKDLEEGVEWWSVSRLRICWAKERDREREREREGEGEMEGEQLKKKREPNIRKPPLPLRRYGALDNGSQGTFPVVYVDEE